MQSKLFKKNCFGAKTGCKAMQYLVITNQFT